MFSAQTLTIDKIEPLLKQNYEFCYVITNSLDDLTKINELCDRYNYYFTSTMGVKVLQLIKRTRDIFNQY